MASTKSRHGDAGRFFPDNKTPAFLWVHSLSAHSLIHAGFVWLVTGSAFLALLEFVIHWITDFVRCEKMIGFNHDQMIHISCKIFYVLLIFFGIQMPF